jgi:hypothetical protein
MDALIAFSHDSTGRIEFRNAEGAYHGTETTAYTFHRLGDYGSISQPGEGSGRTYDHARALFAVAAIHGNGMPLIEQHHGHMGMTVMLSFAGHLAGAAVDAAVEVHEYHLHGVSL